MRLVWAEWRPDGNRLVIACPCGRQFYARCDRWAVRCPCGASGHLATIRQTWPSLARERMLATAPKGR